MEKYRIFTLSNGLRCVHKPTDSHVAYIGLINGVGSRDERPDKFGLAHFVEHTIFKGTRHRSSWHISNRMESIGGELNAYTSKEETVVYTNSPAGHAERAIELLADLVAYSQFPEAELAKEREVVIEEIKSYLDSPMDNVFDRFEDKIFAGSGPGHNILGTEESVHNLRPEDCRSFLDTHYVPENMTLYVVDSSKTSKIEQLAEKYLSILRHPLEAERRITPKFNKIFNETERNDGHQAHTIMGVRTFDRNDERRFPLFLLNNYLGGPCMNSVLNQELRDKRGYVYTVDSTVGLMSDCGTMQIYFGSDHSHVEKCKALINRTLETLSEKELTESKFRMVLRQYIGQLLVGSDNRESMAMSLGKSLFYYNEIRDVEWSEKRLREVTPRDLRDTARYIMEQGLSSLTLE